MIYRLVMQITDETGAVTERQWMPETESFSAWWCENCGMVRTGDDEDVTELCGYCEMVIDACDAVTCPFCGDDVRTTVVLDHWGEGCWS